MLGARWLAAPIWALARLARDLPGRICQAQEITWPLGRIVEQDALIHGYKKMTGAISQHVDDINEYSRRLEYLAERDTLTGLLNRVTLPGKLRICHDRARAEEQMVAVLFVDLDKFKSINDTYGHDAGDALLVEVASRFRQYCPAERCSIFRQGDEFIILLEGHH